MILMLHPMAYCAFALMECAFGYPFAPSMLSFVKLFFAAIELAPVPMSVLIVLPLILCTMHSESADFALAGIVNILAVIHTLHIVAYLTFALMARSYAFPISPIMLGLVFGPIAAFLGACMPMVYFIIAPFIAIIMFLLVSALALAANDHMIFLIKLLGAAIELALVPMGVLIVLPLILCTMHSESADIALAGGENILAVIRTLHIVAYLTFALMARSYAFPISPIMLMLFITAVFALTIDNGMHVKIGIPFAAFMRAGVPMVIGVIRPICFSFVLVVYLVSASRANICTVFDFLPCMCSGGFGVMHVAAFVFAHMEVLIWNCRPLIAPFMLYVAPFVAALCAYIVAVAVRRFGIDMSLYIAVMRSAYFAGLIVVLRHRHLVAYPLGSIGIIQMVFLITAYA